jgi:hypothetical protein
MSSIINEALTMLNDLELNIGDVSGKLSQEQRQSLAGGIDQVVQELGQLNSTDGLTELDFSELANQLINVINSYDSVRQALSADDEISSAQERAAQLAVLEKNVQTSFSRAAQPAESDKKGTAQFEFLANQIINRCQIIRKKLDQ